MEEAFDKEFIKKKYSYPITIYYATVEEICAAN